MLFQFVYKFKEFHLFDKAGRQCKGGRRLQDFAWAVGRCQGDQIGQNFIIWATFSRPRQIFGYFKSLTKGFDVDILDFQIEV